VPAAVRQRGALRTCRARLVRVSRPERQPALPPVLPASGPWLAPLRVPPALGSGLLRVPLALGSDSPERRRVLRPVLPALDQRQVQRVQRRALLAPPSAWGLAPVRTVRVRRLPGSWEVQEPRSALRILATLLKLTCGPCCLSLAASVGFQASGTLIPLQGPISIPGASDGREELPRLGNAFLRSTVRRRPPARLPVRSTGPEPVVFIPIRSPPSACPVPLLPRTSPPSPPCS
jgi:hypothetical protein